MNLSDLTDKDYAKIEALVAEGFTSEAIADKMGRRFHQIKNARRRLKHGTAYRTAAKHHTMEASTRKIDHKTSGILVGYGSGRTIQELARDHGVEVSEIQQMLKAHKADKHLPPLSHLQHGEVKRLRKEKATLEKEAEQTTLIAQALVNAAPKSYQPLPNTPVKLGKKSGTPVSFLAIFSDWHVGAEVDANETLGLGNYNTQVFLDRIWTLQQKMFAVAAACDSPIEELVVCLGGDMMDGKLDHGGVECAQSMDVTSQVTICAHTIAQLLRNLSAVFPTIRVYTTQGNHARLPSQKKTPANRQASSFDTLISLLAKGLTRDVKNIEWVINKQIFQKFDVQNHKVLLLHGHTMKTNGQAAISAPLHSLSRLVSWTAQTACKVGERNPDFICFGHFHKPLLLPVSSGFVIGNGTTVGVDAYAIANGFSLCEPSQNLVCIHPQLGLVSYNPLYLQDSPPGCGKNFQLDELLT